MVRCAPVVALVTVTCAPRTAKPCGSVTVPERVAVLTCATPLPAKLRSNTKRIVTHTHRLRCMLPPSCKRRIFEARCAAPSDGASAALDGNIWIYGFYCNKQMLSIENLAAGAGE